MTSRLSRRQVLCRVLGGLAAAAFAGHVSGQLFSRRHEAWRRRTVVRIPVKPFDARELFRPHDWAG